MAGQHGGIVYRGKAIWSAGKYFESNKDIKDYPLTKKSDHRFSNKQLIAQNRVILDKVAVAVLGFRYGALEVSSLLESGVASVGDLCPTFLGENLLLFSSSVNSTERYVAPGIRDHYVDPLTWCHIQENWRPQDESRSADQNDEEGKGKGQGHKT